MSWWRYRPYVSAAQKRAKAEREARRLQKSGKRLSPIRIEGSKIAKSFWGRAWCDNLESYSDYENRLPRGRTYVRNGSVLDLQIRPGEVTAVVSGSSLYHTKITVKPVAAAAWRALKRECAGQVHSLMDLLLGRLSGPVMEVMTRPKTGLFPKPAEIGLSCSCPDWADMCKHVAAALYGVGSRLDENPELLFALRGVDHAELISEATASTAAPAPHDAPTLDDDAIADVFGIEIEQAPAAPPPPAPTEGRAARAKTKKPATPATPRRATKQKSLARAKKAKSSGHSRPSARAIAAARKRIRQAMAMRLKLLRRR